MMDRRRLKDGLIGAGIATGVIALALVVMVLVVTRPVSDAPVARPSSTGSAPPSGAVGDVPPTDLATGDLWLTGLSMDAGTLATPDGVLHDVVVTGDDVRTGAAGLQAGTLTVVATVPFELVAEQIGSDVAVGPVPGKSDQAAVYRSFEAAGRVLDVEATGTVLARDGLLVIEPRTIDVGGPAILAELFGALARRLVTIEHAIEGIPEGLVLTDLSVQDDGFRATLTGTDVRIAPRAGQL